MLERCSTTRFLTSSFLVVVIVELGGACASGRRMCRREDGAVVLRVYHNTGGPAPAVSARVLWSDGLCELKDFDLKLHCAKMDSESVARLIQALDSPEFQELGSKIASERYEDDYHDYDMIAMEHRGHLFSVPSEKVPAALMPFLKEIDEAWSNRFRRQYRDRLVEAVLTEQNLPPED